MECLQQKRSLKEYSAPDWMPYNHKNNNETKMHPEIKQKHSRSAHQCLRETTRTTKLDSSYHAQEKKNCLSMTWKLVNNSWHGIETNDGTDTLRTSRLTTCQPFHLTYEWTHLNYHLRHPLSRQMQVWQEQDLTGSYHNASAQEWGISKLIPNLLATLKYSKGEVLGIRPNEKISKLFPLMDGKGVDSHEQCIEGL